MGSRAEEIAELRRTRRYADALSLMCLTSADLLSCVHEHHDRRLAFRHHFLGHRTPAGDVPCLLLDAVARGASPEMHVHAQAIEGTLGKHWTAGWQSLLTCFFPHAPVGVQELLEARWRLLALMAKDLGQEDLKQEWLVSVTLVAQAISDDQECPSPVGEPAFLKRLEQRNEPWCSGFREVESLWREFRGGPSQPDWDHPALLQVGEALDYIAHQGEPLPIEGQPVETWVLLETANQAQATDQVITYTDGLLARLVIEKVPGGSGLLYPDCRYNAYLPLGAEFLQGLRNVMTVIRRRPEWTSCRGFNFDYRWRLTPLGPEDGHNLPVLLSQVDGRSAEAAFACAMLAILRGERLDQRVVVSACFADPSVHDDQLANVEGHRGKVLGLRDDPAGQAPGSPRLTSARQHLIDQIVLFGGNSLTAAAVDFQQPLIVHGWKMRYQPAQTLDEAYRQLSRYCRIADEIKSFQAQSAAELLDSLGGSYTPSRLSRDKTAVGNEELQLHHRRGTSLLREQGRVPASLKEINAIGSGRPWPERPSTKRLWFFGAHGYGKSTLLSSVQQRVASSPGDLVPIRLGAGLAFIGDVGDVPALLPTLKQVPWQHHHTSDLRVLGQWLYQQLWQLSCRNVSESDVVDWFTDAVKRGDILFLLDDVDQESAELADLATFLRAFPGCTVYVTGSTEPQASPTPLSQLASWDTLRLEQFTRNAVFHYCADDALAQRLWNKVDWRPLLTVPLTLRQTVALARIGVVHRTNNQEDSLLQSVIRLIREVPSGRTQRPDWPQDFLHAMESFGRDAWSQFQRNSPAGTRRRDDDGSWQTPSQSQPVESGTLVAPDQDRRRQPQGPLAQLTSRFTGDSRLREWFAAIYFAKLPDSEQESFVRQHALDERWEWVFRFAISALARQEETAAVDRLAYWLLKNGAAILLWDIIDPGQDGIAIASRLDRLCRWLVSDFLRCNESDMPGDFGRKPEVDRQTATILDSLFELDDTTLLAMHRDWRWLDTAWDLVLDGLKSSDVQVAATCERIRDSFMSEVDRRIDRIREKVHQDPGVSLSPAEYGLLQMMPDDVLVDVGLMTSDVSEMLRRWPETDGASDAEAKAEFNQRLTTYHSNYARCPPTGRVSQEQDEEWRRYWSALCEWKGCFGPQGAIVVREEWSDLPDGCELMRLPISRQHLESFAPALARPSGVTPQPSALNLSDFFNASAPTSLAVWLTGTGQCGRFVLVPTSNVGFYSRWVDDFPPPWMTPFVCAGMSTEEPSPSNAESNQLLRRLCRMRSPQ